MTSSWSTGSGCRAPSESQPIPASRTGPFVWTLWGEAREVWRSATEHPLVFDDPRDERRYEQFELDTTRLTDRLPTRDANTGLVHRLNQASRAFPPLLLWLGVGLVALAVRRPERALVALAPAVAALLIIVGTSLVAFPVAEYAVPVGARIRSPRGCRIGRRRSARERATAVAELGDRMSRAQAV